MIVKIQNKIITERLIKILKHLAAYKNKKKDKRNEELLTFHKQNIWEILNRIRQNELILKRLSIINQSSLDKSTSIDFKKAN
jgi:rRNA pseudouridine-1189 N-methylase Emg1 (Nep1/Mra1 family)